MSHDTEAAYASSEIADILTKKQNSFFFYTLKPIILAL